MNSFINCRFCEQVIDSLKYEDDKYRLLFGGNYIYVKVLFNNQEVTDNKKIIKLLKKIQDNGNIYKQLNRKYISETYEEWKEIVDKELKVSSVKIKQKQIQNQEEHQ